MKIVIIGNDNRTTALARVLIYEGHFVIAVPGILNEVLPNLVSVPLKLRNEPLWAQIRRVDEIIEKVIDLKPDLVISLHVESSEEGLIDELKLISKKKGFLVFGITQNASRLETSKNYGISVARQSNISIPDSSLLTTSTRQNWTEQQIKNQHKIVLKEDGLAGGRGTIIVPENTKLSSVLSELTADEDIILQEYIAGEEVAFSLLCRGRNIKLLNVNFEYKREFEGDVGSNTPGMGTVAKTGWLFNDVTHLLNGLPEILEEIGYNGPLDINFIIDAEKKRLVFLEFTTRFGDPELSSEILLLKDWSRLFIENASNLPPDPAFNSLHWAVGVVVRGGRHSLQSSRLIGDRPLTHDLLQMPEGDESSFSTAGNSLKSSFNRLYKYLSSAIPEDSHYRTDIGHDTQLRLKALEIIIEER
jgi:phosphoribosylamine-glycine ligase